MKILIILIFKRFFLGLAFLDGAKQSISCSIIFFLTIIDLKRVLTELLGPTNLAKAQAFRIHKSTEVIMVNKDKNLVFVIF